MTRTLPLVLAVSLLFLAGSGSLVAFSRPVVEGTAAGVELCPQYICQAAIFAAQFQGQVGRTENAAAPNACCPDGAPNQMSVNTPVERCRHKTRAFTISSLHDLVVEGEVYRATTPL